jgi:hypothetical protein
VKFWLVRNTDPPEGKSWVPFDIQVSLFLYLEDIKLLRNNEIHLADKKPGNTVMASSRNFLRKAYESCLLSFYCSYFSSCSNHLSLLSLQRGKITSTLDKNQKIRKTDVPNLGALNASFFGLEDSKTV